MNIQSIHLILPAQLTHFAYSINTDFMNDKNLRYKKKKNEVIGYSCQAYFQVFVVYLDVLFSDQFFHTLTEIYRPQQRIRKIQTLNSFPLCKDIHLITVLNNVTCCLFL